MQSPEQEPQDDQQFRNSGGSIIEYTVNGQPQRWLCGKNEAGKKVDPAGVNPKEVMHSINHDGRWEGKIANPDDLEEKESWSAER